MDSKDSIKEYARSLGIELVGFSKCRAYSELIPYFKERQDRGAVNEFEEKDIGRRVNPLLCMESGKTIVSVAFPYFHGEEGCGREVKARFSKYTQGADYHAVVSDYLGKICARIQELGGKAEYFVDSNSLPERYIASLSGIGFIGRNNMLITRKYGSYVFLGEIITDLEIEEDAPAENLCGGCLRCVSACPTGALREDNPNICLSYITQKKELEDSWLTRLDGRLFGCDTCQDACPFNRHAEKSPLECFKPYSYMCDPDPKELAFMSGSLFRERYKKTSCGWRGKAILQRNALISLFQLSKDDAAGIRPEEFASPMLRDICNRLLRVFKL